MNPSRSGRQSTIRNIIPESLEKLHLLLSKRWLERGDLSLDKIRIDSTVVASNITPPRDSQLLNDAIRVISRLMMKSKDFIGIKIRFTDKRSIAKSLAFQIFNGKKSVKDVLYIDLLKAAHIVIKQAERFGMCACNSYGNEKDVTLGVRHQALQSSTAKSYKPD